MPPITFDLDWESERNPSTSDFFHDFTGVRRDMPRCANQCTDGGVAQWNDPLGDYPYRPISGPGNLHSK
jgi:hypothetical protein